MSDLFTVVDESTASTSEITNELSTLPGIGGVTGNLGVTSTEVTAALPKASASSIASNSQILSELSDAVGKTGYTQFKNAIGSTTSTGTVTPKDFRTQLVSKINSADKVIFNVSPSIDEARQANYEHLTPVHHPGTIQVYKNTDARTFNLTAKLIARTAAEATANLKYMNLIRSWVMPYYGSGTASSMADKLGAPPDILLFSSYGDVNINQLPVVLLTYHWVYPDNVDYIPSNDGFPCPTLMDISLSLIEAYAPEEYSGFDISKYKTGDMVNAYTFSSNPTTTANTTQDTTTSANSNATTYTPPQGASISNSPTSL